MNNLEPNKLTILSLCNYKEEEMKAVKNGWAREREREREREGERERERERKSV